MSTKKELEIIDLDALVEPIARIAVRGKQYDIVPVTGVAYDLSAKVLESKGSLTPRQQAEYARSIVRELVPSMDETEAKRLSPGQISRIISIASRSLRKVEARIKEVEKNGHSPTRRTGRKGR